MNAIGNGSTEREGFGDRERWQSVLSRDRRADGGFVYAVRSTGIYCRPSCPSRRPRFDQVAFFPLPEAAEQAGFRACLRCRPREAGSRDPRIQRVRELCRMFAKDEGEGPLTLKDLSRQAGLSPFHLQRTFKETMGITPRQYAEACRLRRLKELFKKGEDVTRALYEAGYGSASRLYEKASARLGMTPATYRRGGRGMRIGYTIADSPLGRMLVAGTKKGICAVSLGESDPALATALAKEYPAAEIHPDESGISRWVRILVSHLKGKQPALDLPLDLRVTAFQWQVYEALRTIPYGATRTYQEIARSLGRPRAVRAVARACATNPAAIVIPCHRAVRKDGSLAGYRWGLDRKRTLLQKEGALRPAP